jgi:hypothetical protein
MLLLRSSFKRSVALRLKLPHVFLDRLLREGHALAQHTLTRLY